MIETRTISPSNCTAGIKSNTFIVKDYQRGYRWESQQVIDLLEDLLEFNSNNHTTKYCMQPLVVKKASIDEIQQKRELSNIIKTSSKSETDTNPYVWELIDGQQRLTTTLLILDSCNSNFKKPPNLPYRIFYSLVRPIDQHYINVVKDTIDDWFSKFDELAEDKKNEIKGKLNSDVEFIWYEVDENTNSVDVFNKLNIGKIPLTNAELFKAQLLNPDHKPFEIKDATEFQITLTQIAFEWDKIEQSLRDNDFWSFISNDDLEAETRIDYLLRLYAIRLKEKGEVPATLNENDTLFPFIAINNYLRVKNNSSSKIWEEIVDLHDMLKSWYNSGESNKLYHYIGFLIAVNKSTIKIISDLIKESAGKRKSQIETIVVERVKQEMRNIALESLSYAKDGVKIQKVLLLFNLQTLIESKTNNRFSFEQYKKTKWNIEHIHARATDEEIRSIKTYEKRKEFLEALSKQFEEIEDSKTLSEIQAFIAEIKSNNVNEDRFLEFCCNITERYGDFDENGLGNLTLLDEETNKSYHNALYPVKRKKIIERDKGDVFIPVATKNVFLKMYSSKLSNMMSWTKDDADDYLKEIERVLVKEAGLCQLEKN